MPMIGTTGLILIILVALLLFGPSKLPELGKAFGRTLREFKSGAKELIADTQEAKHAIDAAPATSAAAIPPAAAMPPDAERKAAD